MGLVCVCVCVCVCMSNYIYKLKNKKMGVHMYICGSIMRFVMHMEIVRCVSEGTLQGHTCT